MPKNKSLEGLRGIAALNVAICHFLCIFIPEALHKNYLSLPENKNPGWLFELTTLPFFSLFYNGHYAVMVFFVISGHALTKEYFSLSPLESNIILRKRLLARYFRLALPIATAIAISYAAYNLGLYYISDLPEIENYPIKDVFFNENYSIYDILREAFYTSILHGQSSFIPILWTVKVEFIGSLYIILFYILKPISKNWFFVFLFFIFLLITQKNESLYFIAILCGSLIGFFVISKKTAVIFFVVGLYFGGFQFKSFFYDFLPHLKFFNDDLVFAKTFYNLLGALFTTIAIINGFGKNILEKNIFQFLGYISFSLYLTHIVIICSLSCLIYIYLPKTPGFLILNFIIYIVDCLILSALFYNYIDRTSIDFSKRISNYFYSQEIAKII